MLVNILGFFGTFNTNDEFKEFQVSNVINFLFEKVVY